MVDGLGRLRAGTETLTLVGGGTRQHVLSYGYDMRSQLLTASVSNINGATWTAAYTYDEAGNVTQQTVGGVNTDFEYDGDLMTDKGGNALDWDADGRMISGLSRSLTYNWDSKLRSVTFGSTTVDLRYDPDGNRVLRSVTNSTTTTRKYIVDTQAELPTILMNPIRWSQLWPRRMDGRSGSFGKHRFQILRRELYCAEKNVVPPGTLMAIQEP